MVELIGPKVGGVRGIDGSTRELQRARGRPSVLFDAVAVIPGSEGAAELAGSAAARDFVADAFAHHKFIGHSEDARPCSRRPVSIRQPTKRWSH